MPARVDAGAETVHWGYFDAALSPVVTIDSGEVVTIGSVSGPPDVLPRHPFVIPPALPAIHAAKTRRMVPGHMLTGPVAVRGARPGQVLQVDIEAIDLAYDWGYVSHRPLGGALPHDFPERGLIHPKLDANTMTAQLPWGMEIALKPFFGNFGVAPEKALLFSVCFGLTVAIGSLPGALAWLLYSFSPSPESSSTADQEG